MPGVLAAITGLMTALTGLIATLDAVGIVNVGDREVQAELATSKEQPGDRQATSTTIRPEPTTITTGRATRTTGRSGPPASVAPSTATSSSVTSSTTTSSTTVTTVKPGPTGQTSGTTVISPEDCIPYRSANLQIVNEGAAGWLLTDGSSRMLILDNESDAKSALALAKAHTKQCFIGRNNQRPDRKTYIVEYWEGTSGLAAAPISPQDCLPYDPANVRIIDEGATGWLLTDGVSRMLVLDNQTDAGNALTLAKRHRAHCFIGRSNQRADRASYIVEYWT
ncbi:MAG: hypothetical protein AB1679_07880 [Actinomycetota bacterium]